MNLVLWVFEARQTSYTRLICAVDDRSCPVRIQRDVPSMYRGRIYNAWYTDVSTHENHCEGISDIRDTFGDHAFTIEVI